MFGNHSDYSYAKSLQSCPTLCDPRDSSPPGSSRPWDSPGKNTRVGCHFLLQCRKVKSERKVTQSCLTSSDPMDCSLPGSSIHGIFHARVLEWGAIAFSATAPYLPLKTICLVIYFIGKGDGRAMTQLVTLCNNCLFFLTFRPQLLLYNKPL